MLINGKYRCAGCTKELASENATCSCGFDNVNAENPTHTLQIGEVLAEQYVIGRVIGEGGFGITYVGWDRDLDIKVAIKEFFPNGFSTRNTTVSATVSASVADDGEFFDKNREKFINEAKVLASFINEPGIVSVYRYFKENNTVYIVMEYIDGISLKEYLKRKGRLTVEETIGITGPIMNSLAKVHEKKLIHRDISPDNIMITDDGRGILIDFGAARDVSEGNKSLSVVLKHGFAPVEQYQSKGDQGPWTDVYALSATMYRCITGVVPMEAIDRMAGESIKTVIELEPTCPQPVSYVIMKGLSVSKKDRYKSVGEMKKALMNALNAANAAKDAANGKTSQDMTTGAMAGNSNNTQAKGFGFGFGKAQNKGQNQAWGNSQMMNNGQNQTWGNSQMINKGQNQAWGNSQMMNNGQNQSWGNSQAMNNGQAANQQNQAWGNSQAMNNGQAANQQNQTWGNSQAMNNGQAANQQNQTWGNSQAMNNGQAANQQNQTWGNSQAMNNGKAANQQNQTWGNSQAMNDGKAANQQNQTWGNSQAMNDQNQPVPNTAEAAENEEKNVATQDNQPNVQPVEQATNEKPAKKKGKKLVIVLVAVVAVLVLLGGGIGFVAYDYSQCCYSAGKLAEDGEFVKANDAIKKYDVLAKKFDKQLCDYINAGVLYENKEYGEAQAAFNKLGNYRKSSNLSDMCEFYIGLNECDELAKAGKYEEALKLLNSLKFTDIATRDTLYVKFLDMAINDADKAGYGFIFRCINNFKKAGINCASQESSAYSKFDANVERLYNSNKKADIISAVAEINANNNLELSQDMELFDVLSRETSKSVILKALLNNVENDTAKEMLLSSDYVYDFLRGTWKDSARNYFKMDSSHTINYSMRSPQGNTYDWKDADHTIYVSNQKNLTIEIISKNEIAIYSHLERKTYYLKKNI